MADDFQLIIKQMEKERKDKIAADKKAEARQLINNEKSLKAFQDQSNKDADKLQELLTSFATEVNASNREAIQAQIDNLKEDRRIKEEIEKGRLEDIQDRIKEKAEIKDIRSKEKKELDERKSAFEKFKESIAAKGEDPEKNAQVREEGIKLRKEEFALRVKNLEGTDLMAARLEEMGNEIKDRGLDPEKNAKFQKESLALQRAQLRERLKNAESPSEKLEILKDQESKDKKALSFSQKQLLTLNRIGKSLSDSIPSKEDVGKGIFGFLKKAALITFLLFLPKILNSDTAKKFVKKISDNMPQIKEGITAIGNFIVDTAIAIAEVALILKDLFTGNFKSAFDRLSKNTKDAFDESPDNENSLIGKMTLILGAIGLFKLGKLLTKFKLLGSAIGALTTTADTGLKNAGVTDTGGKKLTKANLKAAGLKMNQAGRVVDAKTGKFATQAQMKSAGFTPQKPPDQMKKLGKFGRIGKFLKRVPVLGYVLSLGSIAATVMNKDMTFKEKAAKIGAELGGLAGAGVGAILGSAILPLGGTLLGGLAGYFGGEYIFTKLFEYLLGGTEKDAVQGLSARKEARGTPSSYGGGGGGSGDFKLQGRGAIKANLNKDMKPVIKDAEAITPTGGVVDDYGGVGDAMVINNNSSNYNTSNFVNGSSHVTALDTSTQNIIDQR